jgi:glucose/arabinose dehydrogenase
MKSSRRSPQLFALAAPLFFSLFACEGEGSSPADGEGGGTGVSTGGNLGSGGSDTGGSVGTGGAPILRVPGTDNYNCDPAEGAPGTLQLTEVGSGFTQPILVVHPPNDARLFVVEQEGVIKLNGGGTFLDITDRVIGPQESNNSADERGLLGLAFHPNFAQNGLFYVHYNQSPTGNSIVAEYSVGASADEANKDSERVLLTVSQVHINHKGGTIAFGPDGHLYIGLGDGGGADGDNWGGDPDGNGQNLNDLHASILRIAPSGNGGYTSPAGNFPGALPEIWSKGLRNPYRMNFDACTGDLYIGDVGQNVKEELDIVHGGDSGKNFGWSIKEGTSCFNRDDFDSPLATCNETSFTPPVLDYDNDGGAAIIGGAVYRGSAIPWLRGTYFYADNVKNFVYSITYDRVTGTASSPQNRTGELSPSVITAIQNGADGELYFVSALGSIYQLTAF